MNHYLDLGDSDLATVSYVKNPIAEAGIALKSLSENPLYSPGITRPPLSSTRTFAVAKIPLPESLAWMRVLIKSKGYPTAHAVVAANAPEIIGVAISSAVVAFPSLATNLYSVNSVLAYSYEANQTPCGTPSLSSVAPNPFQPGPEKIPRNTFVDADVALSPTTCCVTLTSSTCNNMYVI